MIYLATLQWSKNSEISYMCFFSCWMYNNSDCFEIPIKHGRERVD